MQRLVYAPTVNAWIKTDNGIIDISQFITAGSVNRKVNQVSSAQITVRNPKLADGRMLFTEHLDPDTGHIGALLHPMDPIIITLTRLKARPIQVFTGYCDSTPYLQLFPGTVTIRASCTLKRLMYTFFDPGLDFTQQFLRQYGWFPDVAHGGISAPQQELAPLKSLDEFNDGSIADLLKAVLINVGGWDDSTIYIEALPKGIGPLVVKLFQQFQESEKETTEVQERFQDLLTTLIGSHSTGSGAPGSSGAVPSGGVGKGGVSLNQFNQWAQPAAEQYGIRPSILFAICEIESSFGSNRGPSSQGAVGLMQFEPTTARGLGFNPLDDKASVFGAAKYLNESGAPGDYRKAIFTYNHSTAYVNEVLATEKKYLKYNP
jgi:hypothetical protein